MTETTTGVLLQKRYSYEKDNKDKTNKYKGNSFKITYRNSWNLDARFAHWTLDAGFLTLDSERWTLHAERWIQKLHSEL